MLDNLEHYSSLPEFAGGILGFFFIGVLSPLLISSILSCKKYFSKLFS